MQTNDFCFLKRSPNVLGAGLRPKLTNLTFLFQMWRRFSELIQVGKKCFKHWYQSLNVWQNNLQYLIKPNLTCRRSLTQNRRGFDPKDVTDALLSTSVAFRGKCSNDFLSSNDFSRWTSIGREQTWPRFWMVQVSTDIWENENKREWSATFTQNLKSVLTVCLLQQISGKS